MVKVREDLTGQKFGRLTAMYQTEDYVDPKGRHCARWHCICDCEEHNEVDVLGISLKNGNTLSCGCLQKEGLIHRSKKHNEYKIENNIVYIKLSNCNEYTMVNLDKWNEISYIKEFCWRKSPKGYVESSIPRKYQKNFGKITIGLHQLICPCKNNLVPDHLDRNPLNNLTANLKAKTQLKNCQNKSMPSNNTSGYMGVCWSKKAKKWIAQIVVDKQNIYLGSFIDKENAIKARQDAEIKYFGEYRCKE